MKKESNLGATHHDVTELRTKWSSLMDDQIKKVISLKDYFYNSDVEEAEISPRGDLLGIEKITLSGVRQSLARIKIDARNLEASLQVIPKKPIPNNQSTRLFEQILNNTILNDQNHKELYSCFDNILDMSYSVLKIDTESYFDEADKKISTRLKLECVPDIEDVFFDSSVPLSRINEDGRYVGYHKIINEKNKPIDLLEYWEKHYKTVKYGVRRSKADPDKLIAEKAKNGVNYFKKYKITEVSYVSHREWRGKELIRDEIWPYKCLPFLVGVGVHIDHFTSADTKSSSKDGKRVALAPFAETVKKPQMILDYAVSLQMHNLKMSRGTTKFMIPSTSLSPEQLATWKARNTQDVDLPYDLILDNSGNPILGVKPEPVPDVPLSPTVSEAVSQYPVLINSLLGINLEHDVTKNASGEAIKSIELLRHNSAKLYFDNFISLLNDLGKVIEYYIPILYAGPQYIAINNNGTIQNILINQENSMDSSVPTLIISDLIKSHTIIIKSGKNKTSSNEQTRLALEQLYKITSVSPELGSQVINSTLDIYANSLDSPASADISQRMSLLVPAEISSLSKGEVTVDELKQNQQVKDQQNSQMQQQFQQMQMQLQQEKMRADQLEAQANMIKAKADVENAHAKVVESHEKLKATELKTNAEIAKSFRPNS